jgi:hypothetical protein
MYADPSRIAVVGPSAERPLNEAAVYDTMQKEAHRAYFLANSTLERPTTEFCSKLSQVWILGSVATLAFATTFARGLFD